MSTAGKHTNHLTINNHPIWKTIKPYKKIGHLARFYLAKQYLRFLPSSKFIGIVGSVGKTSTAIACKMVLSEKLEVISSTDTSKKTVNLDPIFNLPMTVLRSKPKVDKVILELGIEHPGEMDMYLDFVTPETVIVTRLTHEHTEFFGTLENVLENEGRIVERLPKNGIAILNYDDVNVRKLADKTGGKVLFYGFDQENCHLWAGNIKIINYQICFELNYGVERVEIRSKLLGSHLIYSLLAAATLGVSLGFSLTTIKRALEKIEPADHRLQAVAGFNGSVILDDTYNAQPVAVEEALETLNMIPSRRRIVVLGEMRELGEYSEQMHRQIARKIFKDKCDLVFLGGGDAKYIEDELLKLGYAQERLQSNLQNPQIVSKLLQVISKGDVILVKGARAVRLDEVVKKIAKKG